MQLTVWPITKKDTQRYHYDGGDPDFFVWDILDDIGDRIQKRTDGGNLAPELLDPFIFAQFVSGLQGKYTVNGSPFGGNWRMMPAARRMAGRLGATDLENELIQAEKDIARYDTTLLDAYDGVVDWTYMDAQPQEVKDELFWALDQRFGEPMENGGCTSGTSRNNHKGSDQLLAALCDWLMLEFPREVLDSAEDVAARLRENHNWACDNVENYELEYTSSHLGREAYDLLNAHRLRFAPGSGGRVIHVKNGVSSNRFKTTDGRGWLRLWFADGLLIVEESSLVELGRAERGGQSVGSTAPTLSEAHKLAYDPKTLETRRASRLNPFAKFLKPSRRH